MAQTDASTKYPTQLARQNRAHLSCGGTPSPTPAREKRARCSMQDDADLIYMLCGPTLTKRRVCEDDTWAKGWENHLDMHIRAMLDFLNENYVEMCRSHTILATKEIRRTAQHLDDLTNAKDRIVCKQAMLLFSYYMEPEAVCETNGWSDSTRKRVMVEDVKQRVLPLVIPNFVDRLCQTPDELIRMVAVLCVMWPDEPIMWQSVEQMMQHEGYLNSSDEDVSGDEMEGEESAQTRLATLLTSTNE